MNHPPAEEFDESRRIMSTLRKVRIMSNSYFKNILFVTLIIVLSAGAMLGQTNGFTYQGRLTDGGLPANGNYDLQFSLFDAADGSNQIGPTKIVSSVSVSAGVFTVTLDFGGNSFTGANRFLEISARPSGAASFILLTPRQPITSTPYAVRSITASNAEMANNAQQLAGVAASQYVKTDDARMSDARDPKAGNSNYVQNSTNQQAATNFNISGNGTAGGTLSGNLVNAATQYNLSGQKVMSLSNDNSLSLGSSGNVGIGIVSNSKLAVAGTVESTAGGFKFPDASVQTSAAAKTYFTVGLADLELDHSGFFTNISTLNLPPGVYLLTATVQFQNKANDFLADNTRSVTCYFNNEFLGHFRLGEPGKPMDSFITTMHTVLTQPASGPVSFKCGDQFIDSGHVFAKARRFSAVRVGDLQPQ
jgi:hypothetical protein